MGEVGLMVVGSIMENSGTKGLKKGESFLFSTET